jgi:hypothetical protein
VNCNNVVISGAAGFRAVAADAATVAVLTDSSGGVLAATRAYGDGREAMSLNFAQSPSLEHTLQLFHGVVSWATRGVFLGERHAYIGVQIDDLFLPDDIYPNTGATYRMSSADLQNSYDYTLAKRGQAVTSGLRYHWAFNAAGFNDTTPGVSERLGQAATRLAGGFYWISHTWDHSESKFAVGAPIAPAQLEYQQNIDAANANGLRPFSAANLVPPSYTGLNSANAMQAMFNVGIRYVVADSSAAGYDNPTVNAGIYNSFQPQILMIPRRPTNLYYNVSTPDEWRAEYNALEGGNFTYQQILDRESSVLVQYLLKGENDPWMFHQPDTRAYDGVHSLLGDLLDVLFTKYSNRVNTPLISPAMDDLGRRIADRMRFNTSGVWATVDPYAGTVVVGSPNAATVPVTGACGASNNEFYAGQAITTVSVPANGTSAPLRISAGACGGGTGTGGTTGAGRHDGRGRHDRRRRYDRRGRHDRHRAAAAAARPTCCRVARCRSTAARSAPGSRRRG